MIARSFKELAEQSASIQDMLVKKNSKSLGFVETKIGDWTW